MRHLKRHKWYNTDKVKPDVSYPLIVMTDMGYIFEAVYEDDRFKVSEVRNGKVYFEDYDNPECLIRFMKV